MTFVKKWTQWLMGQDISNMTLDVTWLGTILLAIFVGLFSVVYFTRRRQSFPPGPFAFPVVGNMLQLGREPHKYLAGLRDKYGDVFSIMLAGHRTVVINGIDNINDILLTTKHACTGRPPFHSKCLFIEGIAFQDYTKKWMWMKKQIIRALGCVTSDKEFDFSNILEWSQEDLNTNFAEHDGKPFDPHDAQHMASFNVGCKFVFNKNDDLMELGRKFNIKEIIDTEKDFIFFDHIGNPFNVMPWLKIIYPLAYKKLLAHDSDLVELTNHFMDIVSETHDPVDMRGIADCFLKTPCETTEDHQKLLFCLPELLTASFDTTATALMWTYLFLVKNQDVQYRVQSALELVTGQTPVSLNDRKRLPLIEAVILEAMRMELPIPLGIPKWTLEDCEFKGYKIPKGTVVITNFYSTNKDPNLWDNPEEFIPERFLKEDGSLDRGKEQKIYAFGIGQRKCPGEAVGRAQLFIAVASVLQRFNLIKVPGENYDVIGAPGLTSSPPRFKIIAEER